MSESDRTDHDIVSSHLIHLHRHVQQNFQMAQKMQRGYEHMTIRNKIRRSKAGSAQRTQPFIFFVHSVAACYGFCPETKSLRRES